MSQAISHPRPPVATTLDDLEVVVEFYADAPHVDLYDAADLEEPVVSLPVRDMAALVDKLADAVRRAEAATTQPPSSPEGGTP